MQCNMATVYACPRVSDVLIPPACCRAPPPKIAASIACQKEKVATQKTDPPACYVTRASRHASYIPKIRISQDENAHSPTPLSRYKIRTLATADDASSVLP